MMMIPAKNQTMHVCVVVVLEYDRGRKVAL
jgi:hypothetical protein